MSGTPADPAAVAPAARAKQARRVAMATLIGTTVEWYDFFVYGTAAALVLDNLFFPDYSQTAGTLLSFATFATGWLARPLGGVVAGHFGDRVGRKSMLVITLMVMGVATALIGLLPTHDSIGVAAPLLLVFLRIVQGLAVGGEYGGAVVMAVEHAPDGKRGLYASMPQAGVPFGLLLGTVVFYPFTLLPDDSFLSWGWRVPFLLSLLLVAIGLIVRLKVLESPVFVEAQAAAAQKSTKQQVPLVRVLKQHPSRVLLLIGAHIGPNTFFYTFATFIIAYATTTLSFERGTVLIAVSVAAAVETLTIPMFAALSDRVGRRRIYISGLVFLGITAVPFFLAVNTGSIALLIVSLVICLGFGHAAAYGTQASFFAELFPTSMRYTGLSLGYQTAGALFGGPLPIIGTALVAWMGGAPWLFAGYMVLTAIVSSISAAFAPENVHGHIDDTGREPAASERRRAQAPSIG